MTITSINPATNKTIKVFEPITQENVVNAIARAHSAYLAWKESTFDYRKKCLQKFADLLRANANDYARRITLDMGKRMCLRDRAPIIQSNIETNPFTHRKKSYEYEIVSSDEVATNRPRLTPRRHADVIEFQDGFHGDQSY